MVLENYKMRSFPIESNAVIEMKILQHWLDLHPLKSNFDQSCLVEIMYLVIFQWKDWNYEKFVFCIYKMHVTNDCLHFSRIGITIVCVKPQWTKIKNIIQIFIISKMNKAALLHEKLSLEKYLFYLTILRPTTQKFFLPDLSNQKSSFEKSNQKI